MNRKYTTIVFDLGNVLIPFDHNLWIKNYNEIELGLGDRYYKKYIENYNVHRDYESGKLTDEQFISTNIEWLDFKVNSETFCRIFSEIFVVNENVINLFPLLKAKYKLVLLSNTNHIHKKYGWEQYKFLEAFDTLILSHEIGAVKPEPEIYRAVEEFTKEDPSTHIFIDDVIEYVSAAKNLGWDGIQFVGYENLLQELKKREIL